MEGIRIFHTRRIHVTLVIKRVKSKGNERYYKIVNKKKVNGKMVQKYVKYLGMDPKIEEQDIV